MSFVAPQPLAIDGADFSVAIVAARFNTTLVDALIRKASAHLKTWNVLEPRLTVIRVPGSNELPFAVQLLAMQQKFDVIIALGVLIRGDTIHYQLIADATTKALQRVALDTRVPIINGVVVAENQPQAEARCLGKINRGAEFAEAALEMAALKRKFSS